MKVNKAQLADVLVVSEKTLTEWQKEEPPLPVLMRGERRGQSHEYDTGAVVEWLVQRRLRAVNAETAKDRLQRLQAEEVALRIAEKKGQLINVAQLEPVLRQEVLAFKARLIELTATLEMELAGVLPQEQMSTVADLVSKGVHAALTELARWDGGEAAT